MKSYTASDLKRKVGPIWMLVIGGVLFLGSLISVIEEGRTEFVIFLIVGITLIIIAIALFASIAKHNAKVKRVLEKQSCSAICRKCKQSFSYMGDDVSKHKRWQYGFVICPHCGSVNGHSIDNIIKDKMTR